MKSRLFASFLLAATAPPASAQGPGALELFVRADKGYCIACHQLPAGIGPATRADIGPALNGARIRELGRERVRQLLEDPTALNAQTVMPPYGKHRILDKGEIDALVRFLDALP